MLFFVRSLGVFLFDFSCLRPSRSSAACFLKELFVGFSSPVRFFWGCLVVFFCGFCSSCYSLRVWRLKHDSTRQKCFRSSVRLNIENHDPHPLSFQYSKTGLHPLFHVLLDGKTIFVSPKKLDNCPFPTKMVTGKRATNRNHH